MICQECSEKMATILFTQIVNGSKTVLHLCKECARKKGIPGGGMMPADPVNGFLAGMAGQAGGAEETPDLTCGTCGLTYREFRESGRLGCAGCYGTFGTPLRKLIRKIHGNTAHRGKSPLHFERNDAPGAGTDALRSALQQAVQEENYELAAELRDRIRALERGTGEGA